VVVLMDPAGGVYTDAFGPEGSPFASSDVKQFKLAIHDAALLFAAPAASSIAQGPGPQQLLSRDELRSVFSSRFKTLFGKQPGFSSNRPVGYPAEAQWGQPNRLNKDSLAKGIEWADSQIESQRRSTYFSASKTSSGTVTPGNARKRRRMTGPVLQAVGSSSVVANAAENVPPVKNPPDPESGAAVRAESEVNPEAPQSAQV